MKVTDRVATVQAADGTTFTVTAVDVAVADAVRQTTEVLALWAGVLAVWFRGKEQT